MTSRQEYFHKIYSGLSDDRPPHERLLLGSESTADQRFAAVMKRIAPFISTLNRKDLIVDVGCGMGRYTEALNRMGHRVLGIDYCDDFVNLCKKSASEKSLRIEYQQGTFDDIERHAKEKAAGIYSVGVLQNVDSMDDAIERCKESIRPGGWICVETLNFYSLKRTLNPNSDTVSAHYRPVELKRCLVEKGFTDVSVTPVFIMPKWLSFMSPVLSSLAQLPLLKRLLTPLAHGVCATAVLR